MFISDWLVSKIIKFSWILKVSIREYYNVNHDPSADPHKGTDMEDEDQVTLTGQ